MKANELMIGDWVLHDGEPYQVRQLGIYGVDRDGEDYPAVCVGKPKGVGLIVERNEIEPIPLTPEILEHNFERKGRNYVFSTDFYEVEIHEYNDGMYMLTYTSCEMNLPSTQIANICFIHQLQQAMRLCGVEKEIIL